MSGLVTFFKDSFPNVHNIDYSRSLETITSEDCGGSSVGNEHSTLEYTPQAWTYKEWREFQKDSLKVYLQKRIGPSREEEGEDDDDEDDDDEENDDTDDEEPDDKETPYVPLQLGRTGTRASSRGRPAVK